MMKPQTALQKHRKIRGEREVELAWLRAEYAKNDLIEFACRIDPTQCENYRARHLRIIADKLEEVERGECKRLHITTPPRHWKTSTAVEKFAIYYLAKHPDRTVAVISHSASNALDFSRTIRNTILFNPLFQKLFPSIKVNPNQTSAHEWALEGSFRASLVAMSTGSSPTGRGFHLIAIDDPTPDVQAALNKKERDRQWAWYREVLRDRLEPGGAMMLIMCMTGDTPILMASGEEKPLSALRVGDRIATYEGCGLSESRVVNWKNQGADSVFAIRMESGKMVKANGKHRFLVYQDGGTQWVALQHLRVGESMLRVSGESGVESSAPLTDAESQRSVGGAVAPITTKPCGQVDIGLHQTTPKTEGKQGLDIVTESSLTSSMHWLKRKVASVLFASKCRMTKTLALIGRTSCAWITTMLRGRFVDCSVTTAMSLSGTCKPRLGLGRQQPTCRLIPDRIIEIVSAGVEDVYDIEVERTENFIANGVVSHNSRWHQDDLAGRLLKESASGDGEPWDVVHLKALNDAGEALWPERWPVDELLRIKKAQGARAFAARFQGEPRLEEGTMLDSTKLKMVGLDDVPRFIRVVRHWDLAFSDRDGADYAAGCKMGITESGWRYILHVRRVRGRWTSIKPIIFQMAQADGVECSVAIEANGTQLGYAQDIKEQLKNRHVVEYHPEGNKEMRAAIWGSRLEDGIIYCVRGEWNQELFDEMAYFPNGEHDDMVDSISGAWAVLAGGAAFSDASGFGVDVSRKSDRPQYDRGLGAL